MHKIIEQKLQLQNEVSLSEIGCAQYRKDLSEDEKRDILEHMLNGESKKNIGMKLS